MGDWILGEVIEGSQLSDQILVEAPLPILHFAPFLITSLPCKILFQAKEPDLDSFASIIEQFGKNLNLKTR